MYRLEGSHWNMGLGHTFDMGMFYQAYFLGSLAVVDPCYL